MIVWILAACLGAAVVAAIVLWLALRSARERRGPTDALVASSRAEIQAAVAEETAAHRDEIRRTIARERADTISQLAAEERRLGEERRAGFVERERRASEALADTLAETERRVDERLQGMADDLERAQRHLEAQLVRLTQRQQQAVADVEARIEREAAELGTTNDEQRRAVVRLREELERAAASAVTEALDELEAHTIERRRAVEEITERLRVREAAIAEGIEQAETDARGPARADADRVRAAADRAARAGHRARDRASRAARGDGLRRADARDPGGRGDEALPRARPGDRAPDARGAGPALDRRTGGVADVAHPPTNRGRDRLSDHESSGTRLTGPMAEITETQSEREGEQAKVESWRLHVLIEAGFPLPLAERLAASEADLHTCVDLMRQGCAPATAAEILL